MEMKGTFLPQGGGVENHHVGEGLPEKGVVAGHHPAQKPGEGGHLFLGKGPKPWVALQRSHPDLKGVAGEGGHEGQKPLLLVHPVGLQVGKKLQEHGPFPKGLAFPLQDGGHKGVGVDLPVGMVEGHPHRLPPVLEGHDEPDPLEGIQGPVPVPPNPGQEEPFLLREGSQASHVGLGIHHHLAPAQSPLRGNGKPIRGRGGPWHQGGKPVFKDRHPKTVKRYLRGKASLLAWAKGAVLLGRQEGALLAVGRVDHPLPPQGVVAEVRAWGDGPRLLRYGGLLGHGQDLHLEGMKPVKDQLTPPPPPGNGRGQGALPPYPGSGRPKAFPFPPGKARREGRRWP